MKLARRWMRLSQPAINVIDTQHTLAVHVPWLLCVPSCKDGFTLAVHRKENARDGFSEKVSQALYNDLVPDHNEP